MSNVSKTIDIKDIVVSNQTHGVEDITCGGSLENPIHKLSKKIEKSIFPGLSLSNPTEEDRNFIFRDENDNVMVVDKVAGEPIKQWDKITSMDNFEDGAKYLIVYEDGQLILDGSLISLDVTGNTKPVIIENGIISDENGELIEYSFTISTIEDGYSILANSGKYIGNNSNSNSITSSDTPLVNTISFDEDFGTVDIVGGGNPHLRYNKQSGQTRFRYFKSSSYKNQQAIHLYKLVDKPGEDIYKWKTLVSNDDIDVITEEELDEILVPKCNDGNLKEECCDPITNNIIPCE